MIWSWLAKPVFANYWSTFQVDNDYHYNILAELGTPPQFLNVSLDLGTADLMVVPQRCFQNPCGQFETNTAFNMSNSETLSINRSFFTAEMLSGDTVSAVWAVDMFQLAGFQTNTTFVIRTDTNNLYYAASNLTTTTKVRNTLGIGPRGLELSAQWIQNGRPEPVYDNFLHTLPNSANSWSLWVDPSGSDQGMIIFGGMDPSTFYPETYFTVSIPLLPDRLGTTLSELSQLSIQSFLLSIQYPISEDDYWNFIDVTGGNLEMPGRDLYMIIFESNEAFSMPAIMVQNTAVTLGGVYSFELDSYLVRCSAKSRLSIYLDNYHLIFNLTDYLFPVNLTDTSGESICILDVGVSDAVILPNSIMRNYFMAVDYQNNTISFAKPKPKPGDPNAAPKEIVSIRVQTTAPMVDSTAPSPTFGGDLTMATPSFKPQIASEYQIITVTSTYSNLASIKIYS